MRFANHLQQKSLKEKKELEFPELPAANQGGNCYQAAMDYLIMHSLKNKKMKLVHGLVTGQGPIEGVVYGHAWVEDGNTVIDATKKPVLKIPKQLYYAIGNIKKTFKYDRSETAQMVTKFKTYGPWESTILKNKY